MKTLTTISINPLIMAEAKQKLGNISQFCELAMKEACKIEDEQRPKNIEEANMKLAGKVAELAELKSHLEKLQKEKEGQRIVKTIE